MSLKTTPKGLLAALVALCTIALQIPAASGTIAHAAPAGIRAATPAVIHAAVAPRAQTIGPSSTVTFTVGQILRTQITTPTAGASPSITVGGQLAGTTLAISPTAAPVGAPITLTGNIRPSNVSTGIAASQPVTLTLTDSKGQMVNLGTTQAISPSASSFSTFPFTLNATLPVTLAYGPITVTAAQVYTDVVAISPTNTLTTTELATATLTSFTINAPAVGLSTPATPNLAFPSAGNPLSAPHGVTFTITGTNFAPGVTISPTIVFSNGAGITTTNILTNVTPISNGSSMEGDFTATVQITGIIPYSDTTVISVAATYPYTPAFNATTGYTLPLVLVEPRPALNLSPLNTAQTNTAVGPLGPLYVAGVTNTVSIVSSNLSSTSGTFIPNSPITLTLASINNVGALTVATTPATADVNGVFTATVPFSAALAGTYVITASDLPVISGTVLTPSNVATATISVISNSIAGPPVATTYFAEGYTGGASGSASGTVGAPTGTTTSLNILNPNVSTVLVTTTYILEQGSADITPTQQAPDVVVVAHTLTALSDLVINVAADINGKTIKSGPDAGKIATGTGQKVATIVQTAGYQNIGPLAGLGGIVRGVAVERIIERTTTTGQRNDGDVSLGSTSPNTSYYFAEGYTGPSFQEYLVLLNPSPTVTATVSVLRIPEGSATTALPPFGPFVLAPYQRLTVNVTRLNVTNLEKKIGLIVNSADNPIVAERVIYTGPGNGSAKPGETLAAGMTTAAKQFNFAYGSLTGGADIANPVTGTIVPNSDVAQTIDDRPFITVMNPNIAGQVVAGTLAGTAAAPGPSAHVTVQLRGEDGRLLGFFITDVDAGSRFTLSYNDLTSGSGGIGFPGVPRTAPTRAGVFSAVVSSSERVVAEEAQYYGQGAVTPSGDAGVGAPGLDLVGAPSGESDVVFPALGTSDPNSTLPLSNTVFLYNPGVNPVRVLGTFYGAAGVVAHNIYTVGPDAIQVIGTNVASSGGVAGGSPIPAGTIGAEFSTIQQRGTIQSGEQSTTPETFVATAVTHSADATNWWGSQGLYPLPVAPSCATTTGQPLPGGCP